ncbi:MAG: serine/threonine protein kinase [Planctomycetes bacterium]|nr:serine/threonine protein kinase [Planctomycetota bacterium]
MQSLSPAACERLRAVYLSDSTPIAVDDRYELLRPLGRGGVGEVFLARDRKLRRSVAIKLILDGTRWPDDLEDFRREIYLTAGLSLPGVAPLFDAGETDDGRLYYTMAYVQGTDLRTILTGGTKPLSFLLDVFEQLCRIVQTAHTRGFVHCDLKPENVMIGTAGDVTVLDWGLARSTRRPAAEPALIAGTPGYVPPEVLRSERARIGPRVDVYALGMILREILGDSKDRRLRQVCDRAAQADPARRHATVGALLADVGKARRSRAVAICAAALAFAVGLGLVLL